MHIKSKQSAIANKCLYFSKVPKKDVVLKSIHPMTEKSLHLDSMESEEKVGSDE